MAAGTGHLTFHPELYHVVLTGDVLVSSMMLTFESATRRPRYCYRQELHNFTAAKLAKAAAAVESSLQSLHT